MIGVQGRKRRLQPGAHRAAQLRRLQLAVHVQVEIAHQLSRRQQLVVVVVGLLQGLSHPPIVDEEGEHLVRRLLAEHDILLRIRIAGVAGRVVVDPAIDYARAGRDLDRVLQVELALPVEIIAGHRQDDLLLAVRIDDRDLGRAPAHMGMGRQAIDQHVLGDIRIDQFRMIFLAGRNGDARAIEAICPHRILGLLSLRIEVEPHLGGLGRRPSIRRIVRLQVKEGIRRDPDPHVFRHQVDHPPGALAAYAAGRHLAHDAAAGLIGRR